MHLAQALGGLLHEHPVRALPLRQKAGKDSRGAEHQDIEKLIAAIRSCHGEQVQAVRKAGDAGQQACKQASAPPEVHARENDGQIVQVLQNVMPVGPAERQGGVETAAKQDARENGDPTDIRQPLGLGPQPQNGFHVRCHHQFIRKRAAKAAPGARPPRFGQWDNGSACFSEVRSR
jgi:hypothetical protein